MLLQYVGTSRQCTHNRVLNWVALFGSANKLKRFLSILAMNGFGELPDNVFVSVSGGAM